ncbi:Inner kinetochore subunit mhf1 [Erysiphe neolycopersici]|uniref:Inner kinetochore subunit mhf1 n=1 Tax=Erysiphe neolycopersici TaxID=212602 RepID=A0A420I5A0_9PEZI|nr:Inner kinetochore subunit mhf1 [Erysiphe neolycopersici]
MTGIKPDLEEQLKASLWHKIGTLVSSETKKLSIQHDVPIDAKPQFIGALTEMVWAQIENVAMDLEAFARHAGRSTVGTDDVLLLTRRNEALEGVLRKWVEAKAKKEPIGKKKPDSKGKGKKVRRK